MQRWRQQRFLSVSSLVGACSLAWCTPRLGRLPAVTVRGARGGGACSVRAPNGSLIARPLLEEATLPRRPRPNRTTVAGGSTPAPRRRRAGPDHGTGDGGGLLSETLALHESRDGKRHFLLVVAAFGRAASLSVFCFFLRLCWHAIWRRLETWTKNTFPVPCCYIWCIPLGY